jgi:hypothetical protein
MKTCLNCGNEIEEGLSFCTGACKRTYKRVFGVCYSLDGSDSEGDGSEESPYKSFHHALEVMQRENRKDYVIYLKGEGVNL